jgi:glycosyltransferase involved in cell wall biosynthesis
MNVSPLITRPDSPSSPRVSVVIPTRDSIGFLPEAIATAQAQTLRDIEILVVDDGSLDATWALLLGAAASDPRVRPLRRAAPSGVSAARNAGLAEARGDWIALLDADDLWLPDRLERLVGRAEALEADLLADDLLLRDFETGASLGRMFGRESIARMPQPVSAAELLRRDMPDAGPRPGAIGYAKPLIRGDFLRRHALRFDPALSAGEDLAFYFTAIARGGRFRMVEEAFYIYRQRRSSLSRQADVARGQAEANRRMTRHAATPAGQGARDLLRRRQDLLDGAALAEAAARGSWLDALAWARWTRPARLAGDLRVVAGAARRRLVA